MNQRAESIIKRGYVYDMTEARKTLTAVVKELGPQPAMRKAIDRNSGGEFIKALEEAYD